MRQLIFILIALFALPTFSQNYSSDNRKAIKFYTKCGEYINLRDFSEALEYCERAIEKDPSFAEAYYRIYGIYNLYQVKDTAFIYLKKYADLVPLSKISHRQAINIATNFFENGKYVDAKKYIDYAIQQNPNYLTKYRSNLLKSSIEFSIDHSEKSDPLEIKILPKEVNKYFTQYFPVTTIDGENLFFTKRDGYDMSYDEDIVYSTKKSDGWNEAQILSPNIDSRYSEGAATVSADGRLMIFTSCDEGMSFGSCDLFITTREGMIWSKPYNLGSVINSVYWDSQPSLSADGKTLYFSSARPGGLGSKDIWYSENVEGKWQRPKNLGPTINTPLDETTPFIHVNDRTFFFSSNGWPGFGSFDLYVSTKEDSLWSKPVNLGYSINSNEDQLSWFLTANGEKAYFSEEKILTGVSQSKIVEVNIKVDTLLKDKASYLTGRVRDKVTRKPLKSTIKLYDLGTNKIEYNTESDRVSGKYFITLTENKEYGVYVSAKGYLFEDFYFEAKEREGLKPDTLDVFLTPISLGESFVLENIYFEFDSYKLSPKSKSELTEVLKFLKDNDLKVLIEGHADRVGTENYNIKLSKERAKEVYDYLISKGIDAATLSYKGYGSSKPLNDTNEANLENRRIEFRIVDKN